MPCVLTFGTFDIFHIGHIHYLKQARDLAKNGKVIVVIARDKNVEKFKNKKPVNDENQRLELISHIKLIDTTILGKEEDIYTILTEINPDIILLGHDQKPSEIILQKKLNELGIKSKIVRAKAYKSDKIKSSKILDKILLDH
jgi:FAD synthetase